MLALLVVSNIAWLLFVVVGHDAVDARGGHLSGASSPADVTISGDLAEPIAPGVMVPLDLALDNPNGFALGIESIKVTVRSVDAPRADDEHPCGAADFEVRQLSGDVVLLLDGNRSEALSEMGLARDHWPAVGMRDRPVDQDGCQGASLALAYEARGSELSR